jgi:transcriptional regulator with XRE-family HTH domain
MNSNGVSFNDMADILGSSKSGIYNAIKKKTLTANNFLKIAEYFKKPLDYFLESPSNGMIVSEPTLEYKTSIQDKTEIIELQRDKIKLLEEKLELQSREIADLKKNGDKQTTHT